MKRLSHRLFLAAMSSLTTISFVACSKPESSQAPVEVSPEPKAASMSHVGTWQCPPGGGTQESELGPIRFRLKLTADGQLEIRSEVIGSPGGDRTVDDKGTYVLEGDRFTSEVFSRGEPCRITMENDQLIMTLHDPDEIYRFERVTK